MPFVRRFNTTDCGALTFTGNTLGLSKETDTNNAGNVNSIGAFITLNPASQVPTYPVIPNAGTTALWPANESAAILTLPTGSEVLYAELIWSGQDISLVGPEDLSSAINVPVTFTTPSSSTFDITPENATKFIVNIGGVQWYVRSSNVTTIVKMAGAGQYSVGGVPATSNGLNNGTNFGGWTLAVAYYNPALPVRNLSIYVGNGFVVTGGGNVDIPITGFRVPETGTVTARLLFSAGDGDPDSGNDQVLFGPSTGSLTALSGPNNPVNNFFASQINNDAGLLDTTGTYGDYNADAATSTQIIGGRQGWDITNVDGSATLVNGQTSAVLRLTTGTAAGDDYLVNAFGMQIDSAPQIQVIKSANTLYAEPGDTVTYTVVVSNNGPIDAKNVVVTDVLPAGMFFVNDSVSVNGTLIPGANITSGVNVGTISTLGSAIVSFSAQIKNDPALCQTTMPNQASVTYEFGCLTQKNTVLSNSYTLNVWCITLDVVKSADKTQAQVGDTITFKVIITNSGSVNLQNVNFVDSIPTNTTFIQNSLKINSAVQIGANPAAGVVIGTIAPGESVTVEFSVKVVTPGCPAEISNRASVTYEYLQGATQVVLTGSQESNLVVIPITPTTFKQLSRSETLTIPIQKPDIEEIINTLVDVEVLHTRVIETIIGVSREGQKLTGFKLIIEGRLNQKVEYIADEPKQSVHAAHFKVPFSTYIILPSYYTEGTNIFIDSYVEDIYTRKIDKRTIFKNITFCLVGKYTRK